MDEPKPTGFRRIWLAFFYSMAGFRVVLGLALLTAVVFVGDNAVEYCLLVGSVLLVLVAELLNSAIEATVDRIGTEKHHLSRNAKDMGSAAVFVSLMLVVFVWSAILLS